MKKALLPTLLACASFSAMAQKEIYHVTTASDSFNPSTLTIEQGDTVVFTVTGIHTATQVSEVTWLANEATPLTGGFDFDAGTDTVVFNSIGTVYYVCIPHVKFGMKGVIIVESPLALKPFSAVASGIKIYPNPTQNSMVVQFPEVTQVQSISLINAQGSEVRREEINGVINSRMINASDLEKGIYQVVISSLDKRYTSKIVVQ